MKDILKIIGCILLFFILIIGAYWVDYTWRKKIVKDAIRELKTEETNR